MSSHPPRDLRIVCSSKGPIILETHRVASLGPGGGHLAWLCLAVRIVVVPGSRSRELV